MDSQTHGQGRGRPTKYDEKYVDELIEFFESFVDSPFDKEIVREEKLFYEKTGGLKASRVEFKFVAKRLPTLFGFARKIGVNYTTVWRWAEERIGKEPGDGEPDRRPYKYPDFRNAYKARENYQTEFLTAIGLGGIAPPVAYVFTAKNVLGWRDTTDQRFVDKAGNDRKVPGYVLLPTRKTEDEALADFDTQEKDAATGAP